MFHHSTWAVGSCSSGPPAEGTPQMLVNPTQVRDLLGHPVVFVLSFLTLNPDTSYFFSERHLYVANNLILLGRRRHCLEICLIIATAAKAEPSSALPVPAHPAPAPASRRAFKICRFSHCSGWSPGGCMAAEGAAAAAAAGNGPPRSSRTTLP